MLYSALFSVRDNGQIVQSMKDGPNFTISHDGGKRQYSRTSSAAADPNAAEVFGDAPEVAPQTFAASIRSAEIAVLNGLRDMPAGSRKLLELDEASFKAHPKPDEAPRLNTTAGGKIVPPAVGHPPNQPNHITIGGTTVRRDATFAGVGATAGFVTFGPIGAAVGGGLGWLADKFLPTAPPK